MIRGDGRASVTRRHAHVAFRATALDPVVRVRRGRRILRLRTRIRDELATHFGQVPLRRARLLHRRRRRRSAQFSCSSARTRSRSAASSDAARSFSARSCASLPSRCARMSAILRFRNSLVLVFFSCASSFARASSSRSRLSAACEHSFSLSTCSCNSPQSALSRLISASLNDSRSSTTYTAYIIGLL